LTDTTLHLRAYIAILAAFLVLDGIWIALVAMPLFQASLGAILNPSPNVAAIAAFYPIYAFGNYWLALRPALAARAMQIAVINAAVLGLAAYATFDLTGLAVIKGWTLKLALIDIGWGMAASVIAAVAGYLAGRAPSRDHQQARAR
jgi:uncharacterized membrane protein